jgi:hypothetical protein
MDNKYFFLGTNVNSRFEKLIRIVFGLACLAVSIFWIIFNINVLQVNLTLWITIIFLWGFGFYQIWTGIGRGTRFIEIGTDYIVLKKNPMLSPVNITAIQIEKIELHPMNVILFIRSKNKILLRFGNTYYETNEKIKDELLDFAENNKIPMEIKHEEL